MPKTVQGTDKTHAEPFTQRLSAFTKEDFLKAKEDEFLNTERKLLLAVGAAFVVREQLASVASTARCSLCLQRCDRKRNIGRLIASARIYDKVVRRYASKRKQIQLETNPRKRCREWLVCEMKKGRVRTIRRQKYASVVGQKCVACGSKIRKMSRFLKEVDKVAQSMTSALHNHNSSVHPDVGGIIECSRDKS